MTPTAAGRHCGACAKTVVDFTQQTDAEILAHLSRAVAGPCGRFRAGQLARPLVAPVPASRWRSWLGAVLTAGSLGTLLAPKAAAQTSSNYYAGPQPAAPAGAPAPVAPAATPAVQPAPSPAAPGGALTVSGTVRDSPTQQGLPYVTVMLKGTAYGTSTDVDGAFSLTVPAGVAPVLLVSFIGYQTQEMAAVTQPGQPLIIALHPDTTMMGEVVLMDYTRPWPWHPRRLFNWSKYQVTKILKR